MSERASASLQSDPIECGQYQICSVKSGLRGGERDAETAVTLLVSALGEFYFRKTSYLFVSCNVFVKCALFYFLYYEFVSHLIFLRMHCLHFFLRGNALG